VQQLQPAEAAMLAGVIQSPTGYDPAQHPVAAQARRNTVLRQMLAQGYITQTVYNQSVAQALPAAKDINAPTEQTIEGVDAGYFTSWVQQQIIERYGAPRAFDGGLKIKTTLDIELQHAAEHAVNAYLESPEGPTASLVAIENSTGEVRAMVGGRNYSTTPFNLATNGERQPGSSFKAFDLAAALEDGISPESSWTSKQKIFIVPGTHGNEKFVVHNDEGNYTGSNTLTGATAYSDNSIYAEVGLKVGTKRIARLAHKMGITTPLSTNPAMTIGGLTVGVTALDMAHAYETIAHGGRRVSGTLATNGAPVAIQEVDAGSHTLPDGSHHDVNHVQTKPVLPASVAATETSMLETVLQYGTGKAAAIGQFAAGKTGTTSNYGDAWFVGWDSKYTVAVWVGYPDKLIPMTTSFNGSPVLGGTFPALIWHDFMTSALAIDKTRAENAALTAQEKKEGKTKHVSSEGEEERAAATSEPSAPSSGQPGSSSGSNGASKGTGKATPSPTPESTGGANEEASPTPEKTPGQTPEPAPSAPAESSAPSSPTGGVSPGG
jgi:penicillin-binding protein 1A